MAIEGDLKDISLIGVMQLACRERRKAGLFVSRRGEEGAIYFDTGEIIHAHVGHLSGEEAIYQLLTWTDGRFRMSEQVSIPQKSIGKNWNYLLIEGMKRIDEHARERAALRQQADALSQIDAKQDYDLESDLILLLSNLEQAITRALEKKAPRPRGLMIQTLAEMVNQTVATMERARRTNDAVPYLAKVLADAGEVYPPVRSLQVQGNHLVADRFSNGNSGMLADKSAARQVCQGLILVLEYYFAFFENFFHSMDVRDQWKETYSVFVIELKRTVARLEF
jgi:hypothetical protein